MANLIKNLHVLSEWSEKDKSLMEHAALEHKRYSNIEFKIKEIDKKKVVFQIVQGRSAAENYQNKSRLIEIVHETFGRFFPKHKIIVHTIPYQRPKADQVNAEWIQKQMLDRGVRLKQIAADTGIDYSQLSSLVSDSRPLSQPMKALFYFYFKGMATPGQGEVE